MLLITAMTRANDCLQKQLKQVGGGGGGGDDTIMKLRTWFSNHWTKIQEAFENGLVCISSFDIRWKRQKITDHR